MTAHPSTSTSYDQFPYDRNAFVETHPDRLRTTAMLFGLEGAAPAERCRVLELGCARGGNLIPMAYDLPGSHFVGLDLSARQIDEAASAAAELKLTNVELRAQNLMDVGPEAGEFDYIIAHGVFSWVPAAVQDKVLAICRDHLTANGVAYISYNTYPGWHLREWLRDAMFFHSANSDDPHEKVRLGREFAALVTESPHLQGNPVGAALRHEASTLHKRSDAYLAHEYLETENRPLYFHQFTSRAAGFGLQYLADARINGSLNETSQPQAARILQQCEGQRLRREQYLDFLRNQSFRRSLLCRDTAALAPPSGMSDRFEKVWLMAIPRAEPAGQAPAGAASGEQVKFIFPNGAYVVSSRPILKAAMGLLAERCPSSIRFQELWERAQVIAKPAMEACDAERHHLALEFTTAWMLNLVETRMLAPRFAAEPGPHPKASAVARYQAQQPGPVVNLRHEMVTLSARSLVLLRQLDGSRGVEELAQYVLEQRMVDTASLPDQTARTRAAIDVVRNVLAGFARAALLHE